MHADTVMADALKDYTNSPGMTVGKIAKKYGISPGTLTTWAKKANVQLRGRGRDRQIQPDARTREILELAEALTLEEVGSRFGMSKQRVGKIMKRWKGWQKPRQAPFSVDDIIKWKGMLYKVVSAGPLFGNVVDERGNIMRNFYWSMGGYTAQKADDTVVWKDRKPRSRAA